MPRALREFRERVINGTEPEDGKGTSQKEQQSDLATFWNPARFMSSTEEKTMSKRELIDTGTDKRYVRRDEEGKFKESTDVGRSLSADKRHKSQTEAKRGEGDRGDHHAKH